MSRPSSRRARVLLIAALFGLIAAACGGAETTASTSDAIEAQTAQTAQAEGDAPAADGGVYGGDFVDLNGQTIDLASYEGQDVVLWFWAPW